MPRSLVRLIALCLAAVAVSGCGSEDFEREAEKVRDDVQRRIDRAEQQLQQVQRQERPLLEPEQRGALRMRRLQQGIAIEALAARVAVVDVDADGAGQRPEGRGDGEVLDLDARFSFALPAATTL